MHEALFLDTSTSFGKNKQPYLRILTSEILQQYSPYACEYICKSREHSDTTHVKECQLYVSDTLSGTVCSVNVACSSLESTKM